MKKIFVILLLLFIAIGANAVELATDANIVLHQSPPVHWYSFGFTFLFGFIGGYLIWGLFGALASVLGVYLITKDKKSRIWAWFGCIIGCLAGLTIKMFKLNH